MCASRWREEKDVCRCDSEVEGRTHFVCMCVAVCCIPRGAHWNEGTGECSKVFYCLVQRDVMKERVGGM